jgi:AcrR family transcriptional regulator
MGAPTKSRVTQRAPLTRDRVLNAAVALADAQGTDSLSMRVLANELGCGVMSLYNHVSNKDDMLDGMVEAVANEIVLPADDMQWKTAIRSTAISAHDAFMRHPWVISLWSNKGLGPAKLRYMESILRVFRQAGFSVESACSGYHAVTTHIVGFTFQKLDFPIKGNEVKEAASNFLSEFSEHDIPYFIEHVKHHLADSHQEDSFVFVLDLILDGLERKKPS